ncbi:ABC transporter substrate-binding protein [Paralimibaculum aggregatum]|uniref:ABC transporter substrate-binding protein n=1 Tax=Paralimibaculum aggregatum TaxID=3036245 RepID=A0ABQ6LSS5_9RHOB|nr:ABC transporter substrate-binding protein [Limibaculum sp. NKW23]GMG85128.1 ABC transporter substrate-binding protein [Limibaculum sp. NKW23]
MTTTKDRLDAPTRRDLLRGAGAGAGALGAMAAGLPTLAIAQDGPIVWVAYGGSTQEAQKKTIVAAFMADTGIEVIPASGPDLAKLKAQVQTGNLEWDVIGVIGSQAIRAGRAGLLEKMDYSIVDTADLDIPPLEYCAPYYSYGGGIGYDPARHPEGRHPTNWQEFWDVERFPGRRGLRNRPDENLEMALMADGVAARDLYPLDVDRAFASLDRIKPHVSHWIAGTPQTISLLTQNEIDFVFTYSGRVEAAQRDGQSVAYVYENNIVTGAYVAVTRGSRNRDAAMRLVSYFLKPELQAAFCNIMGYGPSKSTARAHLEPEVLARQPDLQDPGTAITDVEWWAENGEAVTTRFKTWLLT